MAAYLVALYSTPVDAAAFDKYYHETHIPLAKTIPGLRSYTTSDGAIATPAGPAPYHLVATLGFDTLAALQAALGSPEGQATAADTANFAQAGISMMMFESKEV